MALQTREFTGSTGSTYWTWKIKVIEENYIENGVVSTNKVNITIEEYLGRKSSSGNSFFDGSATLKFTAGLQSKSKSFSGGADVKAGAWYKMGSHTFTVDNAGTIDNPTQLSVSGSLVDAGFSPRTAKANGTLSLTPLHTPPVINNATILETNQSMINLGVSNDTIVQFLSQKKFTINTTTYDDATITNYSIYHNNVLIGTSNTNEVNVNFSNVSELIDSGTGYVGLTIAITDSLGGYTTKIFNYPVIKYTRPSIETTSTVIKRKTGNGTVLTDNIAVLNFAGTCYKGNDVVGNANTPTVQYKIWNTTEPNYTSLTTPNTANIKIENYEISNILYTNVYQYKIQVSDNFNATEDNTKKVPTGQSVWSEYKDRVNFLKLTINNEDVLKKITDSLYYKSGDIYTIIDGNRVTVGGSLTSSREQIRFSIFTPKLLTNITSVSVDYIKISVRYNTGGYLIEEQNVTSNVTAFISGDNTIYLRYLANSAMTDATNNTPVSVEILGLNLSFNEGGELINEDI